MGAQSFAEVFSAALRGGPGPVPEPAPRRAPSGPYAPLPPHPFLFVAAPDLARARAVFALDAMTGDLHRHRPRRALTAAQWQCLTEFSDFGATLTPDFTLQELRSAYRWLAHRLHPDRQHACGEAERERRARRFGEATTRYRRLLKLAAAA